MTRMKIESLKLCQFIISAMIFFQSMFKVKVLSMIDAVAITILTTTGLLIILLFSSYVQGQTQTQITIFTGPIHLGNGHTYWTKFHIPQNVKSSYLRGYVHASGSILNTVSVRLYDFDKCPRPDSTGSIDFTICSSPLLYGDYLQAEEILKYINHPGNFYLVLKNNSPLFDKTVSGNLVIGYLG